MQVPLETLSSELDAYLAVLRNRLLEVINEHYADFVSLSSRLINVDTAVLRMQKPLLVIRVWPHTQMHMEQVMLSDLFNFPYIMVYSQHS